MADEDQGGKIHIDADWKAEAAKEKQRLSEQSKAASAEAAKAAGAAGGQKPGGGAAGAGEQRGIPKASFETLVSHAASQALLFLGVMPDPSTGRRMYHPEMARFQIDTLAVIAEKTEGNLSEDEKKMLDTTLYELRQAYIQVSNAMREQQKGG